MAAPFAKKLKLASPSAKITSMRLFYFDLKARGEPIRLAARHAGFELEDVRVPFDEWGSVVKKAVPFGQMPYAQFLAEDGSLVVGIAQTRAILRTIAKATGKLYGDGSISDMAKIDSVLDFEEDFFVAIRSTISPTRFGMDDFPDAAAKIARRERIVSDVLPAKFEALESTLGASASGWCAGSSDPSIADFMFACSLSAFDSGLWDGVPKDIMAKYPKICSFYDKFYALESVRTYYEK